MLYTTADIHRAVVAALKQNGSPETFPCVEAVDHAVRQVGTMLDKPSVLARADSMDPETVMAEIGVAGALIASTWELDSRRMIAAA